MNEALLRQFRTYQETMRNYGYIKSVINWDGMTCAPRSMGSSRIRSGGLSLITGQIYDYQMQPENIKLLEDVAASDLPFTVRRSAERYLEDLELFRVVPKDVYINSITCQSETSKIWEIARANSDYEMLRPHLEKLVGIRIDILRYRGITGHPYDGFLADFEEGSSMESYDRFFAEIKKLVPVLKRAQEAAKDIDDSLLYAKWPVYKQKKVARLLMDFYKFNPDHTVVGETIHAFASPMGPEDSRIATRFNENNITGLLTICHEFGHVAASLQCDPELQGTNVASSKASGISESFSRFYENYIALTPEFWQLIYPELQAIFPENLTGVSVEEFYLMLHKLKPAVTRNGAGELGYPIQCMYRYEVEKEVMAGRVSFKDAPKFWNDKCEEYTGIRPKNDQEGILNDIHWVGKRGFGTFPAYALGSANGAQYLHCMNQEFNVRQAIADDRLDKVHDWLYEHINRYGDLYSPQELMVKCTGEETNAKYYVDYLTEKYDNLYK